MLPKDSVFRDNLLRGKVAFITGGSSGICLRIAERFAGQGAKVALLGRTQEKLERATAGIREAGGDAIGFSADVRDYAALSGALQKAHEQYGEIDILLCGAAGNFPAPVLGMSANGFKAVIDIDLLGTFNTCRAAYEHLRKPGASVIAISATHAFRPIPLQAHVCAGKAGVDILIKTLAVEWGPKVRVNLITAGYVRTELSHLYYGDEEGIAAVGATIPLGRMAEPGDIGDGCLLLASPLARYISGANLAVHGGGERPAYLEASRGDVTKEKG